MHTLPTITNKDIQAQNIKFITALQQAKQIETDLKAFWEAIHDEMQKHGVTSIKGDFGYLTLASRKTWSTTTPLPPRYYKQVLDTARLNTMEKLGDKLPVGAIYTTATYLSKRIK